MASAQQARAQAEASEARIEARVSHEQKALFEQAAGIQGITLTAFAVATMHRAATNVIQEHSTLTLSSLNQRTFVEALMNPPEPNEALRKAAKAYREMK